MFLERVAIFTLQLRAKAIAFLNSLLHETDSQLGQLFLTCFLIFASLVLFYTWRNPFPLWIKLGYSFVYMLCAILTAAAIYFHVFNKRIRHTSKGMEVYTFINHESKKLQDLNLEAIQLTTAQKEHIFKAFSRNYLNGHYQSFQSLLLLQPISKKQRLEWRHCSAKRPKLVNRQTLLEFLSQLIPGFENLENHQMIELVDQYFILKNSAGIKQNLSSKNISDWRTNKAPYLKEISRIFQQHL